MITSEDFLNTEKMKRPPTLVVIPGDAKNQTFLSDVRYTDFTSALDIPVGYPSAECYIVPPYKPLMYVGMIAGGKNISVYALRGKYTHQHNNAPPSLTVHAHMH